MAVIHWFGVIKKLGMNFSVEERLAVLGDRCLYICKRNADITRCIMVSDIQKLLLAQDDNKDLYVAIIMPPTIKNRAYKGGSRDKPERVEYDLMFHSKDIRTFVQYLRTVYVYQTSGQMLQLDQVKDKRQLETDVRLTRPKGWELTYWQPMLKESLMQLLDVWYKQQQGGGAAITAGSESPEAKKSGDSAGGLDDTDPLAKFLVFIGQSKYYAALKKCNMTLEMLVTGLIDETDLEHFGVESKDDLRKIMVALQDKSLVDRLVGGEGVDVYNPPTVSDMKKELDSDYAGIQPKLAGDDDLDLGDLDLGDEPTAAVGGSLDLGGDGLDDLDLDLGDFDAIAAPTTAINLDLDDLDLDLDLSPTKPAGGGIDLDDLDDLAPAAPAGGGADINLDDLDDL
eukprot:TRINITY_DN11077_c1_g1_i2.p1 TRINITY_DN11077_c1_g1~~TRINITY_DN11077_c1_g1_i2.p1  ORF type:complete len:397 (+),score=112.56 TRINITY_DN11077_c1_g1_i2:216-1406(+)